MLFSLSRVGQGLKKCKFKFKILFFATCRNTAAWVALEVMLTFTKTSLLNKKAAGGGTFLNKNNYGQKDILTSVNCICRPGAHQKCTDRCVVTPKHTSLRAENDFSSPSLH